MKKIVLSLAVVLSFVFQSFGQINPIENLTWSQWYEFPNNYFILEWEEPVMPHDDLIGYNVYREDDLYRFQEETSLYNLEEGSNCETSFLFYEDGSPFYVHVTAVYNPDAVESTYTQTVLVDGFALNVLDINQNATILFPNPTTGVLNIENKNIDKINVLDLSGKVISEIDVKPQIDVSQLSNGIYFLQLSINGKKSIQKFIKE